MLLLLAALAADPASLAGFYRSTTMEVGAAIELEADGGFDYALDYGAVSESASGRWTADGTTLRLAPSKSDGSGRGGPLSVMTIDGSTLILQRYDRQIRLEREGDLVLPPDRNTALQKGN